MTNEETKMTEETRRMYTVGFFLLGVILLGIFLGYVTRDLVEWTP